MHSALGPLEGVGILIVRLDEAVNGLAHLPRTREACSLERSTTQEAKPDLDLVQPRSARRGVVEMHVAVTLYDEPVQLSTRHGGRTPEANLLGIPVTYDDADFGAINVYNSNKEHVVASKLQLSSVSASRFY